MGSIRPRDLLILGAFALCSAWLGVLRSRLSVDVENTAMRSDGTQEAAVDARRDALFGRDSTLLLLLEAPAAAPADGGEDPRAAAWLAALGAVPGARSARKLPVTAPGGGVFAAVDLAPDDGTPPSFAPALERALATARSAAPEGARVSATGLVAGQVAISAALREEEERVLPVMAGVLVLVLLAIYRSPTLVLGAFLPAAGSVLWLGGIQRLLDVPLDPIATLLPPTLLTVGVAGALHLLEGYLAEREGGVPAREAPGAAVRHLFLPASVAVLTTVAGFLGLTMNALPAVRTFGWLASLGVAISAALMLLVLPAWLRVFQPAPSARRGRTWGRIAAPLAALLEKRSGPLVLGWSLLGLVSLAAWTHLEVDTDPLRVLRPDHPFRRDTDRIAAELGGIETFDLLLEAPHPPAAPLALAALAGGLSSLPGVAGPAGAPRRAQDGTWLVPALLSAGGTREHEASFDAALARARDAGWEHAEVAGLTVRVARDSQRLVRGQVAGLGASAALIGAMIVLGLRSLRLGLLGMLPNLLSCAVIYGALAVLGRPLTVASAMIGTVFLGLVVDDTVHLLHTLRHTRTAGESPREAMARALRRTGRPTVTSSVTLAAGFAACLTGRLSTTREFGALAMAIVFVALGACLTYLPALLFRAGHLRSP